MHTHAFALGLTHTLVEPGFRHRAVCPHRGGTPPPDVLGNNIWVTPAGPHPHPAAIPQGDPGPDRQVAPVQASQTRPLTFLSAYSLGAWRVVGRDAGVWVSVSQGVCVLVGLTCMSARPRPRASLCYMGPDVCAVPFGRQRQARVACHVPILPCADGGARGGRGGGARARGSPPAGGRPHPCLLPHLAGGAGDSVRGLGESGR